MDKFLNWIRANWLWIVNTVLGLAIIAIVIKFHTPIWGGISSAWYALHLNTYWPHVIGIVVIGLILYWISRGIIASWGTISGWSVRSFSSAKETAASVSQSVSSIFRSIVQIFVGLLIFAVFTEMFLTGNSYERGVVAVTILLICVIFWYFDLVKPRFAVSLETGYVSAVVKGKKLLHYLLHEEDRQKIIEFISNERARVQDFNDWTPTDDSGNEEKRLREDVKKKALKYLDKWEKVIKDTKNIRRCEGILYSLTGWQWLSWNPFVKILKSDLGKGSYYVQIVRSPIITVEGVDISGEDDDGTAQINVKAEAQNVVWVDFFRIFFTEQSTDEQILGRLETATRTVCSDRTVEQLRLKRFTERQEEAAAEELIEFGLVPGTMLSIIDIILENTPIGEVELQRAEQEAKNKLAEARKTETITNAQADLEKKRLENEASADKIAKEGGAKNKVLKDRLALVEGKPEGVAVVSLSDSPIAALPRGLLAYVEKDKPTQSSSGSGSSQSSR